MPPPDYSQRAYPHTHTHIHIYIYIYINTHTTHVPTRPELLLPLLPRRPGLAEELPVPARTTQQARHEDEGAKDGKQRADRVELLGEDLEDHQGEAELRERGAQVRALEGALGGADLDQLGLREDHGLGAVGAQGVWAVWLRGGVC